MNTLAHRAVALAGVLLPALVGAQTAGLNVPGGAQLMQQIDAQKPPTRPLDSVDLKIEKMGGEPNSQPPASDASFLLQRIEITHHTLFDTPTLLALVSDAQGQRTTLPMLAELAARITAHYRSQGYPLSRAIVPAQTISMSSGVVSIRVVEASYGQIDLLNTSRVHSALLAATVAPLQNGQPVEDLPLKHVLLLLSDIPGVGAKAIYRPGQHSGTSDLSFELTPLPMVTGNLALDNHGNAYTGQDRLSASVTVANPLHWGDTFNASALTSGKGLSHWRAAYELTLNGLGSRAGASLSSLDYALGGIFSPLNASGNATLQSFWVKHPLVRSPDLNVYAQAQYDGLKAKDRSDVAGASPERTVQGTTLSLAGDARSRTLQESVTSWKLAWTGGQHRHGEGLVSATVPVGNSPSSFSRWNLNLAHLQALDARNALYLSYAGQRAQSNLDPSQKMSVGGPSTVRAYAMSTVSGDSGDLLSAEWQQSWGRHGGADWQAVAFFDTARIRINPVRTADANTAWLRGAGIGLNASWPGPWTARFAVAKALGTPAALVNADRSARAWLEVRRMF